jgi:hypothetical protein
MDPRFSQRSFAADLHFVRCARDRHRRFLSLPLMLRFALLLLASAPACGPAPVGPNRECRRRLEKPARSDGDALAALGGKY